MVYSKILIESGLVEISTKRSIAGNEIISVFCRRDAELQGSFCLNEYSAIGRRKADECLRQTQLHYKTFVKKATALINQGLNIGFHGGGFNEGALLQCALGEELKIRFFDNDNYLWGKHLLSILPPILDPSSASELDVKLVIVFPEHYYEDIKSVYEDQNVICLKFSDFISTNQEMV